MSDNLIDFRERVFSLAKEYGLDVDTLEHPKYSRLVIIVDDYDDSDLPF